MLPCISMFPTFQNADTLKQYTTFESSHTAVDTPSEISDCSVTYPHAHVEHETQSK